MNKDFFTTIKNRRSIYDIGAEVIVPKDKIVSITEEALKYTPSAFHSQSARVLLLFGNEHKKLWNIVMESLRKIVPEDKFFDTEQKILSFAKGYGTVVYFDDETVIQGLQQQFPLYQDNFPIWGTQANGMLQLVVWSALEAEGLGASLQHYNPLIDAAVKKEWNIPDSWKMVAQMPFGNPVSLPAEKQFVPVEQRMIVAE